MDFSQEKETQIPKKKYNLKKTHPSACEDFFPQSERFVTEAAQSGKIHDIL